MAIQKKDRKRARAVMKQFELDEAERVQANKDKAWMMREEFVYIEGNPAAIKKGIRV